MTSAKKSPTELNKTTAKVAANNIKKEKYDSFRLRTNIEICAASFLNFNMRKKRKAFIKRKNFIALKKRIKRTTGSSAVKSIKAENDKTPIYIF